MPLNHQSLLNTTMLAQMFPSHVFLGIYWMEVSLVLVKLMVPGIHHLQHVKKVISQIKQYFPLILFIVYSVL